MYDTGIYGVYDPQFVLQFQQQNMRLTESYSTNYKAVGFLTILLIHCLLQCWQRYWALAIASPWPIVLLVFCHFGLLSLAFCPLAFCRFGLLSVPVSPKSGPYLSNDSTRQTVQDVIDLIQHLIDVWAGEERSVMIMPVR